MRFVAKRDWSGRRLQDEMERISETARAMLSVMNQRLLPKLNPDAPISVVTAIYGRHDNVPPIPPGFDEAILVSDRPIASDWDNVVLPVHLPPRLGAKLPRARPDLFTKNSASCWMDANVRDSSGYLSQLVRKGLVNAEMAIFRHPKRTSVAQEVEFLKRFSQFRRLPLDAQLETYQSAGFRDDGGLFYTGIIARRHTEEVVAFGNAWLVEITYRSIRDQVSFPYVMTTAPVIVNAVHEDYRSNIELLDHNRKDYFEFSVPERIALRLKGIGSRFRQARRT